MLSQEEVNRLFIERNGCLYWKERIGAVPAGKRSGVVQAGGYRVIMVKGVSYYEHVLVWVYYHGTIPSGMFVDHKDPSNKLNNHIDNLRLATRTQNNCNRRLFKNNISGIKGVRWLKRDKSWQVRVTFKGKVYFGGTFKDVEEAKKRVKILREQLHGEFARHD